MSYTIVYVWEDLDAAESEQKFGDHYSEAATLSAAFTETLKYIRSSLGRQKHKWAENRIVVHKMWDATEYAKVKNRFGKHKKVDDVIRPVIGNHVSADVHRIDPDVLIERVNRELIKHNQPLPIAGLSQNQYSAVDNVLEAIQNGKSTIMAELCARFGKTIWAGALVIETQRPLTIIASYVLSSISSFKKDLTSFEQFRNLVLVDSANSGWEVEVKKGLKDKKQVVVFLSMCSGDNRQYKINTLFGIKTKRLVIVDEADFGVHKTNQSTPLINARNKDDVVILMTGTNGDKASGAWSIDHMINVTYPELIIEKRSTKPAPTPTIALQHFKVDPTRHQLVADVEFYQMNLTSVVDLARNADPEVFVEDGVFLPSWSKFAANPVKAKGFFVNKLQAVFLGKFGDDSLNVDLQTGRKAKEGIKVAMMFLPGSTTKVNLLEVVPIAQQALPAYRVVLVSGAADVTGSTAETVVKEEIEKAKKLNQNVLILSAGMAARSFSIPEISELYLAYDSGDSGATIQKMSRTLTPGKIGKVGRVISLSFDPNRDDKFDSMLIETAQNYKKTHKIKDLKQALRDVLRTVDVFKCQQDGSVKIEVDDYLEEALSRNSIDRVIGKIAPINDIDPLMVRALATGNIDVYRQAKKTVAAKGKTKLSTGIKAGSKTSGISATQKELARAREMIVTISQNIDIIKFYGGNSIEEAFAIMDQDGIEVQQDVTEQFGVDYALIKELVLSNFINRDLLDLKFS
jgi:hypothetical protein